MRRFVSGMLVAAVCLCLFGCAMGDGYGKYANIYKLLDAGDFAGAHAAIDALAGITPTTAPTTVPTTSAPTQPATLPAETSQPTEATTAPTEPVSVDPTKATFVLNTSSMKIHKLGCGSVETIKEANRAYTDLTREALVAQGYEPCGRCKP